MDLAHEMIIAATEAGADWVKFQAYQTKHLHPSDPQYAWLKAAELSLASIEKLIDWCQMNDVNPLFSVFDEERLGQLREMGQEWIKIGHGDSHRFPTSGLNIIRSHAWGLGDGVAEIHLATIPLYPAPLEAVAAVIEGDGWSDHCIGLDAAKYFIARGATMIEKHFSLPEREGGRRQPWDMSPADLKELRQFADHVAVMKMGTPSYDRWSH